MLISCDYKKKNILLTENPSSEDNLFSVLIGVNGVGKSRLLSAIAINAAGIEKLPISTRKERLVNVSKELNPSYNKKFQGVITSSISPFDKFPVIKNDDDSKILYKYLGVRGISSESVGLNHLARVAGDLIVQCQRDTSHISIVDKVLSYLGYSDWIKFEFKLNHLSWLVVGSAEYELGRYKEYLKNKNDKKDGEVNNKKFGIDEYDEEFYKYFIPLDYDEDIESSIKRINKISVDDIDGIKASRLQKFYKDKLKDYTKSLNSIRSFGFKSLRDSNDKLRDVVINNHKIDVTIDCKENKIIFPENFQESYIFGHLDKLIESGAFVLVRASIRKKNQKRLIGISSASSGEQSVFLSLLGIASYIKNDFLVLVDEPEICLHPSWQEKYIELLIKCFEGLKGCHFIIATHSPQIVANLSGENCYVVNMTENETLSSSEFSKKSADFQLAKLFHSPGHRNEYLLKRITLILAEISSGGKDIDFEEIKDIVRLETFLPENDPVAKLISLLKKAIKIIQ